MMSVAKESLLKFVKDPKDFKRQRERIYRKIYNKRLLIRICSNQAYEFLLLMFID